MAERPAADAAVADRRAPHDDWEAVIGEWSARWGTRVDGWWYDGCYWPNTMYRAKEPPNFESFATAVRAGNLFVVDANLLHRAGPRFVDGAEALCAVIDRSRANLAR